MGKRVRWTAEEDQQLIAYRRMGLTFGEIADAMQRTLSSVHARYMLLRERAPKLGSVVVETRNPSTGRRERRVISRSADEPFEEILRVNIETGEVLLDRRQELYSQARGGRAVER